MTGRGNEDGLLIVLEGSDGCGKSTQARLLVEWMKSMNLGVEQVREPGSTKVSEGIRRILLDPGNPMSARTETYLYCAARSDLYEKVVVPKLTEGVSVVSERDYTSTLAYQFKVGGGVNLSTLHSICRESVGRMIPDLTVFYKPESPEKALKRGTKGREADRMELKDNEFHRGVYENYYTLLPKFLREEEHRRIEIIDSTPEIGVEGVHKETKRIVADLLRERKIIK